MKIVDLAEQAARIANPSAASLGLDIQLELKKAMRKALKPIEPKLRAYLATKAEIQKKIDQWSPESFDQKLHEAAKSPHPGDHGPSRETYKLLGGLAWQEMEQHDRDSRALFAEAAGLIEQPMHDVVARAQSLLDAILDGLAVPRFTLLGHTNGVHYLVQNLQQAGRGEIADLQPLWEGLG